MSHDADPLRAREDLLKSVPIFQGLHEDDLKDLAGRTRIRSFKAGEVIFNLGDRGLIMYIVADGDVNIHLPGEGSRRVSLKDLARGEHFGELAMFDEKPRSASAMATTDATLVELSREMLSECFDRHPRAAMSIIQTMAERLRETNNLLSARASKNAVREVEDHLSWTDRLADRVAELNGSWTFILALLGLTVGWTALNRSGILTEAFDPYPYVFFNLILAILVALQGPLIVMSQNRQSLKDRAQAEADFQVNLKNEVNIETLLREMTEFREEMHRRLGEKSGAARSP